eukprot:TRINITY_DN2929_c0_g1_i2.p1 TRINITY_DN2929_c0_g1~~TRINITY_DN2929_c0_g1_i2.p1  ORF type:complete len:371 (+),score=142.92 TRINITY_DN2929_c0_g1_i2:289-1401(+)
MGDLVLYVGGEGELRELSDPKLAAGGVPLVDAGDALKIQYVRVHIASTRGWDVLGKSKVMVVATVKNEVTKDPAVDSVVLFDDKARPLDCDKRHNSSKKIYSVSDFPADKYGHPVCFYTPGYNGAEITLTTTVKEIDDNSVVTGIARNSRALMHGISQDPMLGTYGVFFALGGSLLTAGAAALEILRSNVEFDRSHTVGFSTRRAGSPFYAGLYVFFPSDRSRPSDLVAELGSSYRIQGPKHQLIHTATGLEYNRSYYVMEVSTQPDPTLVDFDFAASAAGMLKMFQGPDKEEAVRELTQSVVEVARDAFYMGVIKDVQAKQAQLENGRDYSPQERDQLKKELRAKYKQLGDRREWFDANIGTRVAQLVE